jgi:hypothetical protein
MRHTHLPAARDRHAEQWRPGGNRGRPDLHRGGDRRFDQGHRHQDGRDFVERRASRRRPSDAGHCRERTGDQSSGEGQAATVPDFPVFEMCLNVLCSLSIYQYFGTRLGRAVDPAQSAVLEKIRRRGS